jgi:hypothetical protein
MPEASSGIVANARAWACGMTATDALNRISYHAERNQTHRNRQPAADHDLELAFPQRPINQVALHIFALSSCVAGAFDHGAGWEN